MKKQPRAARPDKGKDNDNFRVSVHRQYTINPAIAHGVAKLIGSVEKGKLADSCCVPLSSASSRTVSSGRLDRGGSHGRSERLDPHPQPVHYQPMFAAFGKSLTASRWCSLEGGSHGWARAIARHRQEALSGAEYPRKISKKSMIHNDATPKIESIPRPMRCAQTASF